jgi:alpha-L-fucosidase
MADYSNTSPYFNTREVADYLDILSPRTITTEQDDQSYTIERTYAYRPDLLAYDLYGTPRLWWVFAQRNPDQIEDPIYDFKPGVTIQLPKPDNVNADLGI